VSVYPDELYPAPRSWTERAYPKLVYYNKHEKGGHFAAWEQPQLFSQDISRRLQIAARRHGDRGESLDSYRSCRAEMRGRMGRRDEGGAQIEKRDYIRPPRLL
jgi:hypothetical protein